MYLPFLRQKVSFYEIFLKVCKISVFPWSTWSHLSNRWKGTKDAEWVLGPIGGVDAESFGYKFWAETKYLSCG